MIRTRSFQTTYNSRTRTGEAFPQQREALVARKAFTIGIVAGLRSMMPLALLANVPGGGSGGTDSVARLLHSRRVRLATGVAAAGEVLGDKLPVTPSRISPGPLMGRLVIGALAGMEICRRYDEPILTGAALGAIGAGVGSFVGYAARTLFGQATTIPDIVWAFLEDIAAVSIGYLTVSQE